MKIYQRILFNFIPILAIGLATMGGLTYVVSERSLNALSEKWLNTQLVDGYRLVVEDAEVLQRYGLDGVPADVAKAQAHAAALLVGTPIGARGYLWAVDTNGQVVAHPDAALVGTSLAGQEWLTAIINHPAGKSSHSGNAGPMLVVSRYFAPWKWYVLASAPYSELHGGLSQMRMYMVGFGALLLLAAIVVLMVTARRLSLPLHALATDAERIEQGERVSLAPLDRTDEIGALAGAFNRMTRQLNHQIALEQLISVISQRFLRLTPDRIDDAIRESLAELGALTGADRSYLGEFNMVALRVGATHEWCADGVGSTQRQIQGLSFEAIPWFMERMANEGAIVVAGLDELPPEADAEKRLFNERGICSVVRVAMNFGGHLRGFVGLDAIEGELPWGQSEVQLLVRVGEIFCHTLERQWYQERLSAEKERLSVTLQSIGDGVITTDLNGRVLFINRVARELTGWNLHDAIGQPIHSVFTVADELTRQDLIQPITEIILTGQSSAMPNRSVLAARDGRERIVANNLAPIYDHGDQIIGMVVVFRDITERQRMQSEMVRVEKLESIGVLAGGIAHDFNNILTGIVGNISLARTYTEDPAEIISKLDDVERAAFRARALTQQLLTFAKGGEPVKKAIALDELFHESASFALGGSNVGLAFSPDSEAWIVDADEGQLSQVVNNLVLNAIQAMPDGGMIQADLAHVLLRDDGAVPLPAGRYLRLSVRDEGLGIAPPDIDRIFDPFFTTKETGSGLGLATAFSIIEKHGGHITASSVVGEGTVFDLYLPAVARKTENECQFPSPPLGGSGHVLIMDDEEIVRSVVENLLTNVGYVVTAAADGQSMLTAYAGARESDRPVDVVIMDLTIPGGMGGMEAVGLLLNDFPDARAIVSSGYSTDPVMADFESYGFVGALAKPYPLADLCAAVASAMGAEPSQPEPAPDVTRTTA